MPIAIAIPTMTISLRTLHGQAVLRDAVVRPIFVLVCLRLARRAVPVHRAAEYCIAVAWLNYARDEAC